MSLDEAEFWQTTPRQFDELLKRHVAAQRQADYRAGVIAALVANSIPSTKKRKASQPGDFFPLLKRGGT